MLKSFTFIASFVLAGQALALDGIVYDCKFKVAGDDILADRVLFVVDPETQKSRAYDGVVHYSHGEPVRADVAQNDSKKVRVVWSVMFPFSNGDSRVRFRLSHDKSTGKATIRSEAVSYANLYRAQGRCTSAKGKL